jgi:hypothetical protein
LFARLSNLLRFQREYFPATSRHTVITESLFEILFVTGSWVQRQAKHHDWLRVLQQATTLALVQAGTDLGELQWAAQSFAEIGLHASLASEGLRAALLAQNGGVLSCAALLRDEREVVLNSFDAVIRDRHF